MAKTTGRHDGTRFSTAHTPLREAAEKWKAFLERMRERLSTGPWGSLTRENDPEQLRQLCCELLGMARLLHGVLERLHWPKWDEARSLKSDERAFEQVARHLREGHGELAWGLVHSALTHAEEWRGDNYFSGFGIDLRDYFRAEADAALRVLQKHHLDLMRRGEGTTDDQGSLTP